MKIIIEIGEGLDVFTEDGRCCNGLSFGEMIDQIIGLTFDLEKPIERYKMLTPQQWQQQWHKWNPAKDDKDKS